MASVYSFISNPEYQEIENAVAELQSNELVKKIFLDKTAAEGQSGKVQSFVFDNFLSSKTTKRIAEASVGADYILLFIKDVPVEFGQFAVERFVEVAESTGAGMVYSDYMEVKNGVQAPHPVIDYQEGSLRDDFNFGPVILYSAEAFRNAVGNMAQEFTHAGFYYLRLKVSQQNEFIRVPEFLYTIDENDIRKSGQKIFDYVDSKNRQVQVEMEKAVTRHLKDIRAWLSPGHRPIEFAENEFTDKVSVIIPVRNREKTIGDAIASVLNQKAGFKFNLIVANNYSTDKTTEIIRAFAEKDKRIVHIIPDRKGLGIGGCWNLAVHNKQCGMIAAQLDSDDIYKDEYTLQKIVDTFYAEKCAMVVGTYQLVNFDLEEIPPGIIDHREWTPDNGKNNALRINGLGAPRAFYTPVLREIKIPNVSYGEDYAVGLAISREYKIGRIYENIYLCRRWDDNSDAELDVEKTNKHNTYKDRIRTIELKARIRKNKYHVEIP